MRNGIICNFNLFDMYQIILNVVDGAISPIGTVVLENLGQDIGRYCLLKNIDYVHLYGDESYALKLIEDIDTATSGLYSKKKIEIEVN